MSKVRQRTARERGGTMDYQNLDNETFTRLLIEILKEQTWPTLLNVPDVYEALSEEYNNAVLERWEQEQD